MPITPEMYVLEAEVRGAEKVPVLWNSEDGSVVTDADQD